MASSMFSSNSYGHVKPPLLHALSMKRRKTSTAVAAATSIVRAFTSPRGKHVLLRQSLKYRKMFHTGNGLIKERGPNDELTPPISSQSSEYGEEKGWVTDGESSDREGNGSEMGDGKIDHDNEHWDIMEETGFHHREKDVLLERSIPEVFHSNPEPIVAEVLVEVVVPHVEDKDVEVKQETTVDVAVPEVEVVHAQVQQLEVQEVPQLEAQPMQQLEIQQLEVQQLEVQQLEVQQAEVQSLEVQPVVEEIVHIESQPEVLIQPVVEASPVAEIQHIKIKPTEVQQVEERPLETQPTQLQQSEVSIPEEQPSEAQVDESQLTAEPQIDPKGVDVHPVDMKAEVTQEVLPEISPEVIKSITEVEAVATQKAEPTIELVVEQAAVVEPETKELVETPAVLEAVVQAAAAAVTAAVANAELQLSIPQEATTGMDNSAEETIEEVSVETVDNTIQAPVPFTPVIPDTRILAAEQGAAPEAVVGLVHIAPSLAASTTSPLTELSQAAESEEIEIPEIAEKETVHTPEAVCSAPATVEKAAPAALEPVFSGPTTVQEAAPALPVQETLEADTLLETVTILPLVESVDFGKAEAIVFKDEQCEKTEDKSQVEQNQICLPQIHEFKQNLAELQREDVADENVALGDIAVIETEAGVSQKHSERVAEDRNRRDCKESFLEVLEGRLLATPSRLLKLVLPLPSISPHTEPLALLVNPEQPLSDLERLIQAEMPERDCEKQSLITFYASESDNSRTDENAVAEKEGSTPIQAEAGNEQAGLVRWSLSTEIGGFVSDASKSRSFTIQIAHPDPIAGSTKIKVSVPDFQERTHYLRQQLRNSDSRLDRLSMVKSECDRLAKRSAQRIAFSGFLALIAWWTLVFRLQPWTSIGWEVMELATYLMGLGTVITGYSWFLYHNREVSYDTALENITVTKRQLRMYRERNFDLPAWKEATEESRRLRREVEQLADDYGVAWDGKCEQQDPAVEIHEEVNDAGKSPPLPLKSGTLHKS